jgi:carbonic anhydrase/acetyltransferase-like protein (isoleucine patch superfamily)
MALILPVEGNHPAWGNNCFIAPNATIVGDVVMGDNCSVWFNTVIAAMLTVFVWAML